MLDPDNFYKVFKENFIRDPNVLWIPNKHGAKQFTSFVPYLDSQISVNWLIGDISSRSSSARVWMYDQEPLLQSCWDIYKRQCRDVTELGLHELLDRLSLGCNLAVFSRTIDIPIICHSGLSDQEMFDIQSYLTVTCYYWYHAFISRDWYRHWQYNRSLQPQDQSSAAYRFILYARDFTGTRMYRRSTVDFLNRYRPNILYDWNNDRCVGSEYSAVIDENDARSSSVHLVLETLFDVEKIYLTEKVFKPMVMGQPFIVFGPPGTLEYLRRYGFQTFGSVWSEEYDCETNHESRKLQIFKIIDNLANMTSHQFQETYQKCLPIIEHNRRWFFSDRFMDRCWQELSNNFQTALDQQQQLRAEYPGGQYCHVMANHPYLQMIPMFKNQLSNILKNIDPVKQQSILQRYPAFTSL